MFNFKRKKPKQCSLCDCELKGNYWKIGKLLYCQTCYSLYDICAMCGKAGKNYNEIKKGRKICRSCMDKIPRCSFCSKPIMGRYHRVSEKDLAICNSCYKKSTICFSCGDIIGKDIYTYPDRRKQCVTCRNTSITSVDRAQGMLAEINTFFKRKLQLVIRGKINSFNLIDSPSLKRLAGKRADLFGAFMRRGGKNSIYCLTGLPEDMMYAVLAHELVHMWQAQHCVPSQTEKLREGFAEWGAYKFCLSRNLTGHAAKMIKGSTIYARGLSRMLSWEKKYEYALFLDKIKRNRGLLG